MGPYIVSTSKLPYYEYLWETMVFGADAEDEFLRYTSLEEAMMGHDEITDRLKETWDPKLAIREWYNR